MMFSKKRSTTTAATVRKAAERCGHGLLNTLRIGFAELMPRILITSSIILSVVSGLLIGGLAASCTRPSRYGPREVNISERKLASLRPGATTSHVRDSLGPPSFVWAQREFVPQKYPSEQTCAAKMPSTMWVYYNLVKGSTAVYFDSDDRLVCIERKDIIIAQ